MNVENKQRVLGPLRQDLSPGVVPVSPVLCTGCGGAFKVLKMCVPLADEVCMKELILKNRACEEHLVKRLFLNIKPR